MANTKSPGAIGRLGWAVGAVLACAAPACGTRISVGDLGEEAGGAGHGGALGTTGGTANLGGSAGAGGGSPASGGATGSGPSGGASWVGAGGEVDSSACASDFSQVIEQPIPDCPEVPPPDIFTPCSIDENAICVWQTSAGYEVDGCYLDEGGQKVWSGYSASVGNGGGIHNELCPHTPVPPNESCVGHENQLCRYPSEECLCDQANSTWTCQERPFLSSPPIEVQRLCSPVDEAKLIRDLTDEELDTWCRWSVNLLGGESPLFGPSQPPYDARDYGDFFGGLRGDVCQPILPPDLCARNVRLKPGCDATLRTFNDCIETIQGSNASSRVVVGRGCAPLLDNANCTGVVVMKWGASGSQCPLPLD